MKKYLFTAFLFYFFQHAAFSQNITIKGKVVDAQSKEGLPSCNVFINGSTIGTNSDLDGNYQFNNLTVNEFDLVFSYVGYKSVSKKIIAKAGETITMDVELVPSDNLLTEVQVKSKRDKKWEKQLKKFRTYFLGESNFADKCEIENAWVIDFEEKEDGFYAKAIEPIKIKNLALGYNITFDLTDFYVGKDMHKLGGNVYFTEMTPSNKAKLEEWFAYRAFSYKKSPVFMFKSLVDNKLAEAGFSLFVPKPGSNAVRTDNFDSELGKSVIEYESSKMVGLGKSPELKKIYVVNNLEIHNQSVKSELRTYQGIDYGISWMQVRGNNVHVNKEGVPLNPQDIVVSGDMDYLKVSGMLPSDYDPKSSANEAYFLKFEKPPFAEAVHLHTDRDAYYQGDKLWFKAYLNYTSFAAKDTASKVLYVQLINQKKEIVETQKLEVSNGFAYGNMIFSKELPTGVYTLRSFTNYMRNFSKPLFSKSFPLLARNEKFEISKTETEPEGEKERVVAKLESYDKSSGLLKFAFQDLVGNALGANFSLSVGNPEFMPEFDLNSKITENLSLSDIDKPMNKPFLMEKGLSLSGVFLDKKRMPLKEEINIFVNNLQNFSQTNSDANGNFVFNNLTYYGETDVYLQPVSKKLKEPIFIIKNDLNYPVVNSIFPEYSSKKIVTESSYFEDVLPENVAAAETKDDVPQKQKMLYGRPDYVVEENEINRNNGIFGIQNSILKKVPSLQMQGGNFVLRGGASSVFNSNAALILIDGVPMGSINSVDPNNIARIEVVARMANMYGDLGKNGIISVFLKDKKSAEADFEGRNFTKVSVVGYNSPDVFMPASIKMTNAQNIPTVYWNPEILTNEKGLAEIAIGQNLTLPMKICIEGVTQKNIPFRKVFFLK
ncbi:carboxypeptidase-like regulatory domain-containing protein [Lacihabitans soyangensis]|nr:carboxypeptidase-like regulatory domain-containing protein [Lacihabitans soyangensis]